MKRSREKILIVFLMIIFAGTLFAQDRSTQIFYTAKRLMHQRKYDEALERYELLKKQYPECKYIDDAEFWSAYILEKKDDDKNAFQAYKDFVTKNPESPFVDDAMIYQISVAEKLARKGENNYREFIATKLNSPEKTVKYQASLSLGKLRDSRAIPTLKQIANNGDQDMSLMAKTLIKNINKPIDTNDEGIKRIVNPNRNGERSGNKGSGIKRKNIPAPGNLSSPNRPQQKKKSTPPAQKRQTKKSSSTKKNFN